jgi:hypothetical protein
MLSVVFVDFPQPIKPLPKDTSAFAVVGIIGKFNQRKHMGD